VALAVIAIFAVLIAIFAVRIAVFAAFAALFAVFAIFAVSIAVFAIIFALPLTHDPWHSPYSPYSFDMHTFHLTSRPELETDSRYDFLFQMYVGNY
jgi:hypothetical protein